MKYKYLFQAISDLYGYISSSYHTHGFNEGTFLLKWGMMPVSLQQEVLLLCKWTCWYKAESGHFMVSASGVWHTLSCSKTVDYRQLCFFCFFASLHMFSSELCCYLLLVGSYMDYFLCFCRIYSSPE